MFKIRSIAVRLILAISLTVAAACGILGTFSIAQQRALTQLALDQQLKLQYDSVIAAIDYEGRAALAVSSLIAAMPPVAEALAKNDRDGLGKEKREELVAAARRDIETETRRSLERIRKEVADLTVLATEKVTRKALDSEDHQRLIEEALAEVDFSALATNGTEENQ